MKAPDPTTLETDPRFPSGPWTGYFLQKRLGGKNLMELLLTFSKGVMTGEGRDWVGEFLIRGVYDVSDGKCHWTKRYISKHDVFYQGFNEGKGIWGTWEIPADVASSAMRGGFHIWPEGMADPTGSHLSEEADLPAPVIDIIETEEAVPEPVGTRACNGDHNS
jgi:hypothetical protein